MWQSSIVCRLFGTKPLTKSMRICGHFDPSEKDFVWSPQWLMDDITVISKQDSMYHLKLPETNMVLCPLLGFQSLIIYYRTVCTPIHVCCLYTIDTQSRVVDTIKFRYKLNYTHDEFIQDTTWPALRGRGLWVSFLNSKCVLYSTVIIGLCMQYSDLLNPVIAGPGSIGRPRFRPAAVYVY